MWTMVMQCMTGKILKASLKKLKEVSFSATFAITITIKRISKSKLHSELGFQSLIFKHCFRKLCTPSKLKQLVYHVSKCIGCQVHQKVHYVPTCMIYNKAIVLITGGRGGGGAQYLHFCIAHLICTGHCNSNKVQKINHINKDKFCYSEIYFDDTFLFHLHRIYLAYI